MQTCEAAEDDVDDEEDEGELPYDGPEISETLKSTLLLARTAMEPVLRVAKDLLAERYPGVGTKKRPASSTSDTTTSIIGLNADRGSDRESDNLANSMGRTQAQQPPAVSGQPSNPHPLFVQPAVGASPSSESIPNCMATSNAEPLPWNFPAVLPGNSFLLSSPESQSGHLGPLGTAQVADLGTQPDWPYAHNINMAMAVDDPLQDMSQFHTQQFVSTKPLDQDVAIATEQVPGHDIPGGASSWIPAHLSSQGSVPDGFAGDMPYTDFAGSTVEAPAFVPEQQPTMGQYGFNLLAYQPQVLGTSQPQLGHLQIWPHPQQGQAQEQQQLFTSPVRAPPTAGNPDAASSGDARCMWILPPTPSPTFSEHDELPWGGTYPGPTMYSPDLEDPTSMQLQHQMMAQNYQAGMDNIRQEQQQQQPPPPGLQNMYAQQ